MLDDELEDIYLLEAVEAVEQLQAKDRQQTNKLQAFEVEYHNVGPFSPISINNSQINVNSSKTDFRSRLLQSIGNRDSKQSEIRSITSDSYSSNGNSLTEINLVVPVSSSNPCNINNISRCLVTNKNFENESALCNKINTDKQEIFACKFSPSCPEVTYSNNNAIKSLTPIIRKRKFPGPAGLLPAWTQGSQSSNFNDDFRNEYQKEKEAFLSEKTFCSQNSAEDFCGAWKKMISDFVGMLKCNPLESMNIQWLLRRVTFKGDITQKIPFLIVMIHSIDVSHQDVAVVFKDETGEMNGIISSSVIDKYSTIISQGTVLVIKNATVLSPAGFRICTSLKEQQRKHYINVTANSLVCLYSQDDVGKVTKTEVAELKINELRLLLTDSNKCLEQKAIIEESEHDIENENLELSLFSNVESSVHKANPKFPFRNSETQAGDLSSPKSRFSSIAKFTQPYKLNCMPVIPNILNKELVARSFVPSSNRTELPSVSQFNTINGNTAKRPHMSNKPFSNSNFLVSINNFTGTNAALNKFNKLNFAVQNRSNISNLLSVSPVSTVKDNVLSSQAASNCAKLENKRTFKFVNTNVVNSQNINGANKSTLFIQSDTSKNVHQNVKVSGTNKSNTSDITEPEANIFSNKKLKADLFEDDDDDFDYLLSSIDTDSILKEK